MSSKQISLAERRALLVARADRQRQEMAFYFHECEKPLRIVDTGWNLYRSIRQHPILISLVGALLGKVLAGRLGFIQRLTVWPGRLATAWQIFSRVRDMFARPR